MPPSKPPQPTRFAIQKARGKGWKTLEVGEELAHAQARFATMVQVNPRAYFRLIQLDYNTDSAYEGMEFNWKLIELYDPTQKSPTQKDPARKGGAGGFVRPPRPRPALRGTRRTKERVRIPLRFYLAVVLIGGLIGLALALRYGAPAG